MTDMHRGRCGQSVKFFVSRQDRGALRVVAIVVPLSGCVVVRVSVCGCQGEAEDWVKPGVEIEADRSRQGRLSVAGARAN